MLSWGITNLFSASLASWTCSNEASFGISSLLYPAALYCQLFTCYWCIWWLPLFPRWRRALPILREGASERRSGSRERWSSTSCCSARGETLRWRCARRCHLRTSSWCSLLCSKCPCLGGLVSSPYRCRWRSFPFVFGFSSCWIHQQLFWMRPSRLSFQQLPFQAFFICAWIAQTRYRQKQRMFEDAARFEKYLSSTPVRINWYADRNSSFLIGQLPNLPLRRLRYASERLCWRELVRFWEYDWCISIRLFWINHDTSRWSISFSVESSELWVTRRCLVAAKVKLREASPSPAHPGQGCSFQSAVSTVSSAKETTLSALAPERPFIWRPFSNTSRPKSSNWRATRRGTTRKPGSYRAIFSWPSEMTKNWTGCLAKSRSPKVASCRTFRRYCCPRRAVKRRRERKAASRRSTEMNHPRNPQTALLGATKWAKVDTSTNSSSQLV